METRELPVLSVSDQPVIDRYSAALGRQAARILAYLTLRGADLGLSDAATTTAIRIGTDVGRKPVEDSLDELEGRELIERTTDRRKTSGRPPNAWVATGTVEEVADRLYRDHGTQLLRDAADRHDCAYQEGQSSDSLVLGLNWRPNALHLPLYSPFIAGDFSRCDIGVRFVEHRGSAAAIAAVVEGNADVGVAGAATVLRSIAAGEPLVPIASLYHRSMVVLYTTEDAFGGRLRRPEDLRGRRIGVPAGSETGLLGRLFLTQSELMDTVDVVELDGEEHRALDSGSVDVVTGVYADPYRLERAGHAVDVLPVSEQYPIPGLTLVTRPDRLDAGLGAFLACVVSGWGACCADTAATASAVGEETGMDPAEAAELFERTRTEFGQSNRVREAGWGWISPDDWDRLKTALSYLDLLDQ